MQKPSRWLESERLHRCLTKVKEEEEKLTQENEYKYQDSIDVVRVISYDKYTPEKLMTLLDKDKLEELEEEFEQHPDGIELINFVWLMNSALSVLKEDEYDLIYGLCRLFSDIDINGDLHMEWSEFTQYIIDTVMK